MCTNACGWIRMMGKKLMCSYHITSHRSNCNTHEIEKDSFFSDLCVCFSFVEMQINIEFNSHWLPHDFNAHPLFECDKAERDDRQRQRFKYNSCWDFALTIEYGFVSVRVFFMQMMKSEWAGMSLCYRNYLLRITKWYNFFFFYFVGATFFLTVIT